MRSAGAALLVIALFVAAPAAAEIRGELTAQVTLTTEYVYRGLSQSVEDPAIQGGFHYRHDNGFFAGLWASSVDFPNNRQRERPRDVEVDVFVGYGFELSRSWAATAQLTHYSYPGDDPAFDYDYNELGLSLHYQDRVTGAVHLSDDLLGRGERALAYELSGRQPLGERLDALAGLGHYDLERVVGISYLYWNLGLSYSIGRFALDLAYIDTSSRAVALFGDQLAGERVVASLTAFLE